MAVITVLVLVFVVVAVMLDRMEKQKIALMTPEDREKYLMQKQELNLLTQRGAVNPLMICPHCQTKGKIRTKSVVQDKGISGGKVTAAVVTAGVSILAAGLAKKENVTQAYCEQCNNSWIF